eukprot:symbB.v1.2.023605.t1/scaffold2171.1/size87081/3
MPSWHILGQSHCRYFERRSEETPTVMVSVTKDNFFTFSDSNTPSINLIYALPTSDSPLLQGTATGCSSSAADLTSGNSGCCSTETPCGVNEGVCSSDSRCAGDLQCISYSCSWTSTATDMQDACCVLQGENGAFVTQEFGDRGEGVLHGSAHRAAGIPYVGWGETALPKDAGLVAPGVFLQHV